jgi:hypothetical protein
MARTTACLSTDGGVRRLVDVSVELGDVGVRADQVVAWLRSGWSAVVDDLVVSVSGGVADVLERVLDAHGRGLTLGEVAVCVSDAGREIPVKAYQAALRSRRFRRAADDRFTLADWDTAAHRPATFPAALAVKPGRGVAPIGRVGRIEGARRVSAGHGEDMTEPRCPDERLWLWVRVDADVLRGGEAVVPAPLVEGLGLAPGCRRTFSSRYGPIALAHDGPHTRGSVRPVALAAGARDGDTLLLGFSPAGDAVVDIRRAQGHADESSYDSATSRTP